LLFTQLSKKNWSERIETKKENRENFEFIGKFVFRYSLIHLTSL